MPYCPSWAPLTGSVKPGYVIDRGGKEPEHRRRSVRLGAVCYDLDPEQHPPSSNSLSRITIMSEAVVAAVSQRSRHNTGRDHKLSDTESSSRVRYPLSAAKFFSKFDYPVNTLPYYDMLSLGRPALVYIHNIGLFPAQFSNSFGDNLQPFPFPPVPSPSSPVRVSGSSISPEISPESSRNH